MTYWYYVCTQKRITSFWFSRHRLLMSVSSPVSQQLAQQLATSSHPSHTITRRQLSFWTAVVYDTTHAHCFSLEKSGEKAVNMEEGREREIDQ